MYGFPKTIQTKDGTEITLKLSSREDFEFSLGFFKRQPEADRVYLRRDVTRRAETEERYVEIEEGRTTAIVAIANGMIVGDASLTSDRRGWFRKTGEIRMVVDVNFRGKGLGSLLAREIIEIARQKEMIKLEATFVETQKGIVRTLEKLGFEREGKLSDIVVDLKGKHHDLVLMGKQLEEA